MADNFFGHSRKFCKTESAVTHNPQKGRGRAAGTAMLIAAVLLSSVLLNSCTHSRIILKDIDSDLGKNFDQKTIHEFGKNLSQDLSKNLEKNFGKDGKNLSEQLGKNLNQDLGKSLSQDLGKAIETNLVKPLQQSSSSLDLCFVKTHGSEVDLVEVKRKAGVVRKSKLESAVRELLEGPTAEEANQGLGSEIPRGTILLGLDEKNGSFELNLSQRFAASGGIDSIETRLEQIARTVRTVVGSQPVFLSVEGKRLCMTPGEGVEVKQPINQ